MATAGSALHDQGFGKLGPDKDEEQNDQGHQHNACDAPEDRPVFLCHAPAVLPALFRPGNGPVDEEAAEDGAAQRSGSVPES